ncbi:MAG: hypothetical protein JXA71_14975 [Chitinispirillaceae bacterium]|nr:hypothetical protein [Chitinispirillaceae bacterium]
MLVKHGYRLDEIRSMGLAEFDARIEIVLRAGKAGDGGTPRKRMVMRS